MFKISDRVKEASSSTGTGSVSLGGAYSGFQTFQDGIGDGNITYYTIENFARWEVGIGTYTQSTNSLSRDTVLRSSSGQTKISLEGASIVFCTLAADRAFIKDPNNNIGGVSGVFAESGIFDNLIVGDDLTITDALSANSLEIATSISANSISSNSLDVNGHIEANSLSTSDYILSSGLLTIVNPDDSGCFIHAYRDSVNDKTVALHINSNSSPMWKLGLKSTPASKSAPPDHGYVYGVDGSAGIVSNENNYTEMSSSAGLFTYHDSHVLLRASSATGVYIDGKTSSYPILTVQGAAGQAEHLQRWEDSAETILSVVDKDGQVGILTSSPSYELDVNGDIGVSGTLYVDEYIKRNEDTDTYIRFREDQIDLNCGGMAFLTLDENGTDKFVVNNSKNDIDFQVKGDGDTNLIRTDAANDRVGIGKSGPDYLLDVAGTGSFETIRFSDGTTQTTAAAAAGAADLNDLADVSFGGTNLTRTLLINNTPGSAPQHGTLGSDNYDNIAIGFDALKVATDTTRNIAIGSYTLTTATTADQNVSVGAYAGNDVTVGQYNVLVGDSAGRYIREGDSNVAIGRNALHGHTTNTTNGEFNTAVGDQAGKSVETGAYNTFLGYYTGYSVISGQGNIMIGKKAGSAETGNYMLYVASNDESSNGSLIKGDMANKYLAVGKADVTLSDDPATLQVYPNAETHKALLVQGFSLQSADLQEWQDSSENKLLAVGPDGGLVLPNNVPSSTTNKFYNDGGTLKFNGSTVLTGSISSSNRTYNNVTSEFSMSDSSDVVFLDTTTGAINVHLPTAVGKGGKEIMIKLKAGSNSGVLLASGSQTVDGQAQIPLYHTYESTTLISDNSNWFLT